MLKHVFMQNRTEKLMNDDFPDYEFQISTPDMFIHPEDKLSTPDHTWHGCAIGWHSTIHTFIKNIPATNDRITGVCFSSTSSSSLLAISVYFPTSRKDEEFIECISNLANFIMEKQMKTLKF